MRKVICLLAVLLLLCTPVFAQDMADEQAKSIGVDKLEEALPSQAQELMQDVRAEKPAEFGKQMFRILRQAFSSAGDFFSDTAKSLCAVMAALILCGLVSSTEQKLSQQAVRFAGALAIVGICTADMRTMVNLATDTMEQVGSFSTMLLPVMASASVASGGFTSGAALYTGSALFFDVLTRLIRQLLLPLCYAHLALAAAEAATGSGRLNKVRELCTWVVTVSLKAVMYIFTAYLALTGVLSATADEATLKAAKATISTAIPVVGKIVSNASESVLAGAAVIKSAAGIYGLLAIACIGITPFIRIGIAYLGLKLCAAVGGTLTEASQAALVEQLAAVMGQLLAMTGCCLLMAMLSCGCFMKVIQV